tara:strand:- start:353 stop:1066 length:714 start_codon:yes stop_codon:yes gene_type:complete
MVKKFKIEIFADGADIKSIKELNKFKFIKGFTTNPSLMKIAGVKNYKIFAQNVLKIIKKKPVSFEVFSDDIDEMEKQAKEISSWGKNAYVKIPITNTKGQKTLKLIKKLNSIGIKCNVTAILTIDQVEDVYKSIKKNNKVIISIFAGRIADTGRSPIPIMKKAIKICKNKKNIKILWASTREALSLYQAEKIGTHIITVPYSILSKIKFYKKDLKKFSLDTVKTFYNDAKIAGYKIN